MSRLLRVVRVVLYVEAFVVGANLAMNGRPA